MSDERVRALLREIERELDGSGRTLADVIRERLRIDPREEAERVASRLGQDLTRNDVYVSAHVSAIRNGIPTEDALVSLAKILAAGLRTGHAEQLISDQRIFLPRDGGPVTFRPIVPVFNPNDPYATAPVRPPSESAAESPPPPESDAVLATRYAFETMRVLPPAVSAEVRALIIDP